MRTRPVFIGLAAGALALTVGCSGSDDSDDSDHVDKAAPLSSGYSVRGALAEIPESAVGDDTVLVQTADLRAATKAAGVEFPTDGSREATSPWLMALTDGPSDRPAPGFVPLPESFNLQSAAPDEFADVLGWSVLDVDSFVEYSLPPGRFAVVTGDFDDDTLSGDLSEVADGIVTDREAEDFETDLGSVNATNPLGVPTRLARQADRIALGTSTPAVRAWLDGDKSLAEDDSLSAVAGALDDEDVVSAVLTSVEGGQDPAASLGARLSAEQLQALSEQIDGFVPEDPFDAVGIGWAVDDGETEVHVAYHFESDDAARDGAKVLEKTYREGLSVVSQTPFSDYLTVDEVDADGSVVTVSVTPVGENRDAFLYQAFQQRELLFVSR